MSKKNTPQYELRRRSKTYVGLWEGDRCLAGICTKKPRGTFDALLILRACNAHKDLLAACKTLIDANQHVKDLSLNRNEPHRGMMWGEARSILDAAKTKAETIIEKAGGQ